MRLKKHIPRRFFFILLAVALIAATWASFGREHVAAQQNEDGMTVGSALLRLGMDEAAARRSLATYELGPSRGTDTAILIVDPRKPKRVIGSVEFQRGKVTVISRDWDVDPKRPLDAVIGAVTSLHEACADKTATEASHSATPNLADDSIKLRCGVREILIASFTVNGRHNSQVTETLIAGK